MSCVFSSHRTIENFAIPKAFAIAEHPSSLQFRSSEIHPVQKVSSYCCIGIPGRLVVTQFLGRGLDVLIVRRSLFGQLVPVIVGIEVLPRP